MNQIFRVPVDNQHFKDTIETGKPVEKIKDFLTGEFRSKVERIAKDGLGRYWGSVPGEGNKRVFEKLSENDELLCYRSGKYIAVAKIAFTVVNKDLAKYSWGEMETGVTWELIYFFKEVSLIDVDAKVLNTEFGYQEGPVMGFSMVSEEKAKVFLQKHSSVTNFVTQFKTERNLQEQIENKLSKVKINSPFEAQYYLVDLGNKLEFETYVPPSDSGKVVFGTKLAEMITVHKDDLSQYVAPKVFDPLSNIDVIWFKDNYRPRFFYEVIHSTGMNEAIARLKTVSIHYEPAKTRIIGTREKLAEFEKSKRLYFPNHDQIAFKDYTELLNVHSETLHFKNLIDSFLN